MSNQTTPPTPPESTEQNPTLDYLKGADRIIGLVCYLTDAGVKDQLIDFHVSIEFNHHLTSGNEEYVRGVAQACRDYFAGRRKTV